MLSKGGKTEYKKKKWKCMQICYKYKDILPDGEIGQFIVMFSHPQSCSKTTLPESKYNWLCK